jgi:hypothetical protein
MLASASSFAPLVRAQRGEIAIPSGKVPPSIASLQAMTGKVRSFTNQEREARIEKAGG